MMRIKPRSVKAVMLARRMNEEERQLMKAIQAGEINELERLCATEGDAVRGETRHALVQLAIATNQPLVLEVLLLNGWPFEDDSNDDEDDEDDEDERHRSEYGGSAALNLAVEVGSVECMRILLGHGAMADAASTADGMRLTPLHVAAMYNTTASDIHTQLIDSAIDIDARDLCMNTPLHLAAVYGSLAVAEALLKAGADANAMNASGASPLSLAAPNGYVDLVDLLLRHGANANSTDSLGNTPLIDASFVTQADHFACGDAVTQHKVITRLLQFDVDMDAANRNGDTAIAGAIRNGYIDAAIELLKHGASVTCQNRRGETVLHIAARVGIESVDLWRSFVDVGADVHARDRYDRTCYDVWMSRPKTETTPEQEAEEEVVGDRSDAIARMIAA